MIIELQEGVPAPIVKRNPYAIVAITKHGVEHSPCYIKCLLHSDLYYMSKFEKGDEGEKTYSAFFRKCADAAASTFSTI